MTFAPIDLTIIILYLTAMLVIGYLLGRHENAAGFFVNNRRTRATLLVFTALSTSIGAGSVIGVASAAYDTGLSFGLSFAILSLLGWWLIAWLAPRIKQWGDELGAYTIGDFLAVRYSPETRAAGVLVIITAYFTATAIQFVAFARLAEVISGVSFEAALVGAALITILYTTAAGIKGDFYTDALQFAVMLPVFIFVFITGFRETDLTTLLSTLPSFFL